RSTRLKKVWSGRLDSNQRPLDPQSSALTRLRYAPTLNPECISYARARFRFGDAFFRALEAGAFRAAARLTALLLDAASLRVVTLLRRARPLEEPGAPDRSDCNSRSPTRTTPERDSPA